MIDSFDWVKTEPDKIPTFAENLADEESATSFNSRFGLH
jgi:hypothetical protein